MALNCIKCIIPKWVYQESLNSSNNHNPKNHKILTIKGGKQTNGTQNNKKHNLCKEVK